MLFAVLVAVMVIHVRGNEPSTTAEVIRSRLPFLDEASENRLELLSQTPRFAQDGLYSAYWKFSAIVMELYAILPGQTILSVRRAKRRDLPSTGQGSHLTGALVLAASSGSCKI